MLDLDAAKRLAEPHQWGCGATHRGPGAPGCPAEPHHHHDARCVPVPALLAEVERLRADAAAGPRESLVPPWLLPPAPDGEGLQDLLRRALRDAYAAGCWAGATRSIYTAGAYADHHAEAVERRVRAAAK